MSKAGEVRFGVIGAGLATTVEDAEAIAAAVRAAGITLMVDFHARWRSTISR